jgi:hypothetical protein
MAPDSGQLPRPTCMSLASSVTLGEPLTFSVPRFFSSAQESGKEAVPQPILPSQSHPEQQAPAVATSPGGRDMAIIPTREHQAAKRQEQKAQDKHVLETVPSRAN